NGERGPEVLADAPAQHLVGLQRNDQLEGDLEARPVTLAKEHTALGSDQLIADGRVLRVLPEAKLLLAPVTTPWCGVEGRASAHRTARKGFNTPAQCGPAQVGRARRILDVDPRVGPVAAPP